MSIINLVDELTFEDNKQRTGKLLDMLIKSYQYITFENNNLHIPETFSANSAFLAVNEMRQSQGKN